MTNETNIREEATRFGDGWMSENAQDMFTIAVNMAGFDAKELATLIIMRSMAHPDRKVNEATVTNAMQDLRDERVG